MVTDPLEPYFAGGSWGHDGTQWRPLNLLWGYNTTIAQNIVNLNATAGTNVLTSMLVPLSEVWVITCVTAYNTVSNCTRIGLGVSVATTNITIYQDLSPAAWIWSITHCNIILKNNDSIFGEFYGCTAGDDLYMRYCGYRMRVNLG